MAVDAQARTVLIPAKAGKTATAAFDDIRTTLPDESFADTVQLAVDAVDSTIDDIVHLTDENDEKQADSDSLSSAPASAVHEDADFSDQHLKGNAHENLKASTVSRGDLVMVYWPAEKVHYGETVKTLHRNGGVTVLYDDGENERLDLGDEEWHHENPVFPAHSSFVRNIDQNPKEILRLLDHFCNKILCDTVHKDLSSSR